MIQRIKSLFKPKLPPLWESPWELPRPVSEANQDGVYTALKSRLTMKENYPEYWSSLYQDEQTGQFWVGHTSSIGHWSYEELSPLDSARVAEILADPSKVR